MNVAYRYLPEFLVGLAHTALLSLEVIVLGTLIGLLCVPARISSRSALRWLVWILVNPFRIVPAMVLLVWGFYSFPMALGVRLDAWTVAVIALGLNMGAFCAEIFRKAVEEVPVEHVEAAQLLGLSRVAVWKRVIFPLALRKASIPYLNQVLQTIKLTVLAALISVREIYNVTADLIQQTNKPLEMYTMLALLTLLPLLCLTVLVEWIERHFQGTQRVRRWTWLRSTP